MINYILGVLIFGGAVFVAYKQIRKLKRGKGCACGCGGCAMRMQCNKSDKL
jgi:hypothetical protein